MTRSTTKTDAHGVAAYHGENDGTATLGKWEVVGRSGVLATHAALLHTGDVLFFTRPERPSHTWSFSTETPNPNGLPGDENRPPGARDTTLSSLVPTTGLQAFQPSVVPVIHNPFCSGHAFLDDGTLLVVGGDRKSRLHSNAPVGTVSGLDAARRFVPGGSGTGTWREDNSMSSCRWYPTCALLPDGRVFIVSGSIDDLASYNNQNPTCEIFPPAAGGMQYLPPLAEAWPYVTYPFVYLLPSGELFLYVKDRCYFLQHGMDAFERERWVVRNGPQLKRQPAKQYPNTATSVLLPLLPPENPESPYQAEVLLIGGGGWNVYAGQSLLPKLSARNSCFRLKVHPTLEAEWKPTAPMAQPRVMADSVLLPDGKVLVLNGSTKGFAGGNPAQGLTYPEDAQQHTELYDPVIDEWRTLARSAIPRLYHSTALLLPDARVLVAGSDQQIRDTRDKPNPGENDEEWSKALSQAFEYRLEVFSPPYLFSEYRRPTIGACPDEIRYVERFEVEVAECADSAQLTAVLLRPASVTHGNNMDQRYVGLRVVGQQVEGQQVNRLVLESPPNGNVAPPGYYMLFLVDRGVPSVAKFIRLLRPEHIDPPPRLPNGMALADVEPLTPPPGMAVWLRADQIDGDDGDQVNEWQDQSGQGNHVTLVENIGDGAIQVPTTLAKYDMNGRPAVRFTLAASPLVENGAVFGGCMKSTNQSFLPGSEPYVIFAVVWPWPPGYCLLAYKTEGHGCSAGWGDLVGWGDFTRDNSFVGVRFGAGPLDGELPRKPGTAAVMNYWNKEWQFGNADTDPGLPMSGGSLLEVDFNGERTSMRRNGSVIKDDPAPPGGRQTGNGPLTIGRNTAFISRDNQNTGGAFFRGDIAEIIIYGRWLSDRERHEVEEYLRAKYSLW